MQCDGSYLRTVSMSVPFRHTAGDHVTIADCLDFVRVVLIQNIIASIVQLVQNIDDL